MKKYLIALFAFALLFTACANTSTEEVQETDTITISDFAFAPETIKIAAGGTVTWLHDDAVTHTIASEDFESENMERGDSFSYVFEEPGTYEYRCGIHPSMRGTIIVE